MHVGFRKLTNTYRNSSRMMGLKGAQASKHFQTLTQRYRKHMPASHTVLNADGLVPSETPNKATTFITFEGNKSNGNLLPGETYVIPRVKSECEVWDVRQRSYPRRTMASTTPRKKPEMADKCVFALLPLSGCSQKGE